MKIHERETEVLFAGRRLWVVYQSEVAPDEDRIMAETIKLVAIEDRDTGAQMEQYHFDNAELVKIIRACLEDFRSPRPKTKQK